MLKNSVDSDHLTYKIAVIRRFENSVDPDQLASQKPDDLHFIVYLGLAWYGVNFDHDNAIFQHI